MRSKWIPLGTLLFSLSVIIGVFILSIVYASPFARSWDEVDFALALKRYDLLAMQPHFPGYPYFILGAMGVQAWVSDPIKALSMLNTLMALSSVIPMVLIIRRFTDTQKGLLFAALAISSPSLWLMSAQPMSEGAAVAVLWWYLWSASRALEHPTKKWIHILPLFLFSLLMGIRVSFFPFGLAILLLWVAFYKQSTNKRRKKWTYLLIMAVIAVSFQGIWVVGLILSEGNAAGFIELSLAFVQGHFSEWGGGVSASSLSFGDRLYAFFGYNLLWSAGLGHSIIVGMVMLIWLSLISLSLWKRNQSIDISNRMNTIFIRVVTACIGLYTLWTLFGQNIDKPRHITPIIGFLLLFLFIVAVRTASGIKSTLMYVTLFTLISTQFIVGASLLQRQAKEIPTTYQLHSYLSKLDEPFILYTWEETRVLQYLQADYEHKRIFTYDYFKTEAAANPNRRILLTNHVLQGFEQQAGPLHQYVKQVAQFKSDALFEPVYHHIILYEWSP